MIRKVITTVIISLVTLNYIQAQDKFKRELSLGASSVRPFQSQFCPDESAAENENGLHGRSHAPVDYGKNLGLQAELNFIQHGWDEKFEDQPQYKYSRTINYFELPILTHIYFGSKRFRVFVNLGPKIGYAFGEKTDENLNGAKPNTENEQHDMPIEKKFDWGLCGGPGIELRTGIGSFLLEGRYYYALGDIFNSRKEDYFSKSSSQVISAKITYMIPGF